MRSKTRLLALSIICLITTGLPVFGQYRQSMKLNTYEGVSDPKKSEAEAFLDARHNAYRNLAASFSTHVDGTYVVQQIMRGTNLEDVTLTVKGESTITIRMHLTGIEELENAVEKTTDGYIARVLITISEKGRKKAEEYLEQETIGFRAYDYYSRKFNFTPVARTAVPKGYSDFSSWLENNCLVFEIKENRNDFLDQFEIFLQKLNRKISIYSVKFGGRNAKIIYNLPDYYSDIINVLAKTKIKAFRENGRVLLLPEISLNEFKNHIQKMPDAGMLSIAGIRKEDGKFTHISSEALNEIARIAGNKHGLQANILRIPDQYFNNTYKDSEIIKTLNGGAARYTVLIKAETMTGTPIPQYGIPAYNWTSYRCIFHDSITEKIYYGNSIAGGIHKIPLDLIDLINSFLENL